VDTFIQILVSGLTLGAMYAISAAALSLLWGTLNLLNMAQGAMLGAGGYAAYSAAAVFGLNPLFGIPLAIAVGALIGMIMYAAIVRFIIATPQFETSAIIATIGLAIILENVILKLFGAYPAGQTLRFDGHFRIGEVVVPGQNLFILAASVFLLLVLGLIVSRTSLGRAVRATAQNREAAQLMGVSIHRVYAAVLVISGVFAALSGVLLSSLTTLSPTMGYDPMVKAFIVCVLAGLGSSSGTLVAALMLGLIEATVQYTLGVRYGLPVLLVLVILTLIWRPSGLFGTARVVRL